MGNRNAVFSSFAPLVLLGVASAFQIFAMSLYVKSNASIGVILFLCVLGALLVEGIYLLNRYTDDDSISYPERTTVFRHSSWLLILAILAIVVPIFILLTIGMLRPLPVFICGAIIGVLYSVQLIPIVTKKSFRWISLKEIPFVKNLLVALLWGGSGLTIVILIKDTNLFIRPENIILFVTFFVTTMTSTIACDMRDWEGDKLKGLITLPTQLGLKGTGLLLTILDSVGAATILAILINGLIKLPIAAFCLFCILWAWSGLLPFYVEKWKTISRSSHELLIDSHLVVFPIGLAIFGIVS